MKRSKTVFIIFIITIITASLSSCRSKEYHTRSQITLIKETLETVISSQNQKVSSATENTDAANANQGSVFYTKSGKHYHYLNPCGRGTYYECTLEEAKEKGLTPCKKCVNKNQS